VYNMIAHRDKVRTPKFKCTAACSAEQYASVSNV
jgi:hypothetical protein